jgi:small subunit ribosomal protein S8
MSLNDPLANAMSILAQYEKIGKKEALIKPSSKTIKLVLDILNKEGYVGSYEELDSGRGKYLKINILGRINNCGVIKPRFSIKIEDFERREKQYLPAANFGVLILSTNQGIMTHKEALEKDLGGVMIAYCY